MPPTEAQFQALREAFERYRKLPRHNADGEYRRHLHALQQWEVASIRRRHSRACADNDGYARVVNYYLDHLHNGLPLDSMIQRGPQGLEQARRMDRSFPLFANAIEFSVLSAVLQDRLTGTLGEAPLTASSYRSALMACADLDERQRRLELLVELGHQVAPHIRSRMIYTGFKLLKGMFRTLGLGEIHASLDSGFGQLRDVSRLPQMLAEFAAVERQQLQDIEATGT